MIKSSVLEILSLVGLTCCLLCAYANVPCWCQLYSQIDYIYLALMWHITLTFLTNPKSQNGQEINLQYSKLIKQNGSPAQFLVSSIANCVSSRLCLFYQLLPFFVFHLFGRGFSSWIKLQLAWTVAYVHEPLCFRHFKKFKFKFMFQELVGFKFFDLTCAHEQGQMAVLYVRCPFQVPFWPHLYCGATI